MHLSTMIILIQKKHQHFKQNHNDMFFLRLIFVITSLIHLLSIIISIQK
jgi:hypothetical protein